MQSFARGSRAPALKRAEMYTVWGGEKMEKECSCALLVLAFGVHSFLSGCVTHTVGRDVMFEAPASCVVSGSVFLCCSAGSGRSIRRLELVDGELCTKKVAKSIDVMG